MTGVTKTYPNLTFDKPAYQDIFERGIFLMEPETRDIFAELMSRLVGRSGSYLGKIVLGIKPFTVHLFEPDFPDKRICWLAPARHHILVRLYKGTSVGNVMNLITNPNLDSTPYPVQIEVKDKSQIDTALAYIQDSARRRRRG